MNRLVHASKLFLNRNASTILTCVGAVGVVGTTVLAVKATPKAIALLEKAKEQKGEDLTPLETVQIAAPSYIPAAIAGVSTIICIFGANVLNKRQQATLMGAYALLDSSYKEYKAKVDELYGPEAGTHIRAEIAKDHIQEANIPEEDDGKELFFDYFSGRYFRSTIEQVQKAEYNLNRNLFTREYAYLNEFYEDLDLEPLETGWAYGWAKAVNMERHWQEWVDFIHEKTVTDDGLEVYILKMHGEPTLYFENYF
jgi:hypothetical protein